MKEKPEQLIVKGPLGESSRIVSHDWTCELKMCESGIEKMVDLKNFELDLMLGMGFIETDHKILVGDECLEDGIFDMEIRNMITNRKEIFKNMKVERVRLVKRGPDVFYVYNVITARR